MANWIQVKMILSGPGNELARFRSTCIRQVASVETGEIGFDFETLIPMPDHVHQSLRRDANGGAKQEQQEPHRMPLWWEWRIRNWGVKWNASGYAEVESTPGTLTFAFEVPWSFPRPIFTALAEQFPLLSGGVSAMGWEDDWVTVGLISMGDFSALTTNMSRETVFLAETLPRREFRDCTVTRALSHITGLPDDTAEQTTGSWKVVADDAFWTQVSARLEADLVQSLKGAFVECCLDHSTSREMSGDELWSHVCAHLQPGKARYLNFAFDVERYHDRHDGNDSLWVEDDSLPLEEIIRSPETLKFIESNGRSYYKIDRRLMALLAQHFKSNLETNKTEQELDQEFRLDVVHMLVNLSEDELWEWAAHAVFRPAQLDLGTLQTSFVGYASCLRRDAICFLADDDGLNCIAA